MKNPLISASLRIALAAVAIAMVAAACGGADPGDDTLGDGGEADTADYHGDPDIDADSADHHGDPDTNDTTDDHGSTGAPTQYDADVAGAAQTITVEVVGGAPIARWWRRRRIGSGDDPPVGGHQRVEVDLGSVVAVMVASDTAEEVHVHGYDILRAVSDGHPAHFAFTAEIPGVFEVEFEGSGRLLLQLEIS